MDFGQLAQMAASGQLAQMVTAHLGPVMPWLAIGVLAGFAVKVPLMPFHTWLPAAYAEAPSPVTMLLTGAMSKMGVYGLLRIAIPLFGPQIAAMRTPLLVLAVATVVMGAWAAAAQKDLKRVFAYSSVNHLGYCLLGIFALAVPASGAAQQASQAAALNGVILQMFNHGITAAALFWFISMIQFRTGGLRGIDDFGGLRKPAPVFAGLMGIALFSSLGSARPQWLRRRVPHLPRRFSAVVDQRNGIGAWSARNRRRDSHRDSKSFQRPGSGALGRVSRSASRRADGSRACHRSYVSARPCAPAYCGHHQPHGAEPAGALEILEIGLDHLHFVRRRVRCGAAAQGQTRPCALVRARRGRGGTGPCGRGLRGGLWAGAPGVC